MEWDACELSKDSAVPVEIGLFAEEEVTATESIDRYGDSSDA
jgi:hypothetical protein